MTKNLTLLRWAVALLTLLVVPLFACGGDDDDTSPPPGDDDATHTTSPTPVADTPTPPLATYPYEKTLYVRGTLNSWTGDATALEPYTMQLVGPNQLKASVEVGFGPLEFKIADAGWSGGTNFGNPAGTNDQLTLDVPKTLGDNGFNLKITIETPGVYSFLLDTTELLAPVVTIHFEYEIEATCNPSLDAAKARWMDASSLTWFTMDSTDYFLYVAPEGGITLADGQLSGGEELAISFDRKLESGDPLLQTYPYLLGQSVFDTSSLAAEIPDILKGEIVVASRNDAGEVCDATQVQTYGVIDDLFAYEGDDLGLRFQEGVPTLKLWAPTATSVTLHRYGTSDSATPLESVSATENAGVWTVTGTADWKNQYYLYEVEVYVPSLDAVVANKVTDPYSVSLSMNSLRSQLVDLMDPALLPEGWDSMTKPGLEAFEDMVIYELHVRDFSAYDETVPEPDRGHFLAFTYQEADGMKHLADLATAGLSHVHLLPTFDLATINEDPAERLEPVVPNDAPDAETQQAAVSTTKDKDAYNWGYDPFHYMVPEGSYSSNADSSARILEFRKLVLSLNQIGLRVVMDQVYNHTNSAGQNDKSVLDKIVPGYYYRLDSNGNIQSSTCCPDTATEHKMMEKLMIDSLKLWATAYRVDGFRFDLMGHHTRDNMLNARAALDALTLEQDGVDGAAICMYGEAWKFGSLDAILPEQAFNQVNTFDSGIASFNDRIRDSARGGSPFAELFEQGFATGMYLDDNYLALYDGTSTAPEQEDKDEYLESNLATLLNLEDNIRIGLAGNLRDYSFVNADGDTVTGAEIDYRGSAGAGYTADPQEIINYVSVHDNQTLWDNVQAKAPFHATDWLPSSSSMETRVRMQWLGLSVIALGQGIPFFHAGDDLLRSKSGDKDSYNSGDWFNRLDWSASMNNWGVGLPPAEKNEGDWDFWQPRLADEALMPDPEDLLDTTAYFQALLMARKDSPLFRLRTAEDISARVRFLNAESGEDQIPGLIVMTISDKVAGDDLDPNREMAVVFFNASPNSVSFTHSTLQVTLVPDAFLADADPKLDGVTCGTGTVTVPGRTTLICYEE